MTTTLIISPDPQWSSQAQAHLLAQGLKCDVALNGKEGQLKAYHTPYDYCFLDLDVKNNSGLEVCKYLRNARPQSKIFVTIASATRLDEMFLSEKNLLKMGITKVLFQPGFDSLLSHIQSLGKIKTWDNVKEVTTPVHEPEEDTEISDTEFSRVKINEIFGDTLAVFNYYLRLRSNRYIKIIHKGEKPSQEQLEKYQASGAEYIYFKTQDRSTFISYQNEAAKGILKNKGDNIKVIKAMKSATDKYLEEILVAGLQPALIDEGKAICQNMYDAAQEDKSLRKFLNDFEEFNPQMFSHSFLVSFFSTVICKNLDWVGSKTIQTLALGALFHDIGMLQLPEHIRDKDFNLLSPEDKLIYQTHPMLGAESLKSIPGINPGVLQIIQQHHELMNGHGYPNRLSGNKIYPLAKVVCLADAFSYFVTESGQTPKDALKSFLSKSQNIAQFDGELIRNLIKAF